MRKKKKAFTLVELIGVITILAILLLLMIPNITKVASNSKKSLRDSKIKAIVIAGEKYGNDDINTYQACLGESDYVKGKGCRIKVETLIEDGYLEPDSGDFIADPENNGKYLDGDVLLCYNIKNVVVHGYYLAPDEDRDCDAVDLESGAYLNLEPTKGTVYVNGTSLKARITRGGDLKNFECTSENSAIVSCKLLPDANNPTSVEIIPGGLPANSKEEVVKLTLKAYPKDGAVPLEKTFTATLKETSFNIEFVETPTYNQFAETTGCMPVNSSIDYEVKGSSFGNLTIKLKDGAKAGILEGTVLNNKVRLTSNAKSGTTTMTLKEGNGNKTIDITKKVYEFKKKSFPTSVSVGQRKKAVLQAGNTGNIKVFSSDEDVVSFSKTATGPTSKELVLTVPEDNAEIEFYVASNKLGSAKIAFLGSYCGGDTDSDGNGVPDIIEDPTLPPSGESLEFKSTQIKVDPNEVTVYIGSTEKKIVSVSGYVGALTCTSSNPNAANCGVDGNSILIYSEREAANEVTITISDENGGTADILTHVIATTLEVTGLPVDTVTNSKYLCTPIGGFSMVDIGGSNYGDIEVTGGREIDWYITDSFLNSRTKMTVANKQILPVYRTDAYAGQYPKEIMAILDDGYNPGRTTVKIKELNGNKSDEFYHYIYRMSLDNDYAKVRVGDTVTFNVNSEATGKINVRSKNTNIATAVVENPKTYDYTIGKDTSGNFHVNTSKVTVTAVGSGETDIVVSGEFCGTMTFRVVVRPGRYSIKLAPGSYTKSLGATTLSCAPTSLVNDSCEVTFPEIVANTGYTVVGYHTTKDTNYYYYKPGEKFTIDFNNNGTKFYGNSLDFTGPLCTIADINAQVAMGEEVKMNMTCTDTGSGIDGNGKIDLSKFVNSNPDIGGVTSISKPTRIANGYSYKVGVTGKATGTFGFYLQEGALLDKAGNKSYQINVNGMYSSTYAAPSYNWEVGRVNRSDVIATLYDNDDIGKGAAGTYSLVFTGAGDMMSFATVDDLDSDTRTFTLSSPWYDYRDKITRVEIGSGVTNIGEGALFGATSLATVEFPTSLTKIEMAAFAQSGLTTITLPSNLTTIGSLAFFKNTGLTRITIPASVRTIEREAFYQNNISQVTFNSGLQTIGIKAFTFNPISTLTIPNTVTSIGNYAFFSNSNDMRLTTLNLGTGVTTIGDYAFTYHRVAALTLPDSLVSIGEAAFMQFEDTTYKSNLATINFGSGLKTIGAKAFANTAIDTNLVLPNSLQTIGAEAFGYALRDNVTSVTIGPNVSSIGDCFATGKSLTTYIVDSANAYYTAQDGIIFNKSKTTLVKAPDDFYKDRQGTTYNVPSTVTKIQGGAFIGWQDYGDALIAFDLQLPSTLTELNIDSNFINYTIGGIYLDNANFTNVNGVLYNKAKTTIYRLPVAYNADSFTIPDTVTMVADHFAFGNSHVQTITIPNSVTSVGLHSFETDGNYGGGTLYLNTGANLNYDESSFACTVYPEGADIRDASRTIYVSNSTLKGKLQNTYSGKEYTVNFG